jgi:hypothetical protein
LEKRFEDFSVIAGARFGKLALKLFDRPLFSPDLLINLLKLLIRQAFFANVQA